jgi:hypothetical protein
MSMTDMELHTEATNETLTGLGLPTTYQFRLAPVSAWVPPARPKEG